MASVSITRLRASRYGEASPMPRCPDAPMTRWPDGGWPDALDPPCRRWHGGGEMHYDVVDARYVRDYVVWLRFRDGRAGEIDLAPALRGPVFEPLKDVDSFRQLFVHPEFGTLAWSNDVDLAPETLYARVATPEHGEYADSAIREGIVITMFYDEHGRPHFHARSGEHEVSVEIGGQIVRGRFPGRSLRLVLDWEELRRDELMANWARARQGLPLIPIEPLRERRTTSGVVSQARGKLSFPFTTRARQTPASRASSRD